MLEVIVFSLALIVITIIGMRSEVTQDDLELKIPEQITPENTFLSQLQQKVEVTLFPRPSDATLNRHYNALIRAELDAHISSMQNS
jgi:DNA polymerase II small subunit/DNA polymerase delta subunit B